VWAHLVPVFLKDLGGTNPHRRSCTIRPPKFSPRLSAHYKKTVIFELCSACLCMTCLRESRSPSSLSGFFRVPLGWLVCVVGPFLQFSVCRPLDLPRWGAVPAFFSKPHFAHGRCEVYFRGSWFPNWTVKPFYFSGSFFGGNFFLSFLISGLPRAFLLACQQPFLSFSASHAHSISSQLTCIYSVPSRAPGDSESFATSYRFLLLMFPPEDNSPGLPLISLPSFPFSPLKSLFFFAAENLIGASFRSFSAGLGLPSPFVSSLPWPRFHPPSTFSSAPTLPLKNSRRTVSLP